MIHAHKIALSFGKQIVFDHISFMINQSDRIGLVGRNGSGKTTLLKSIMHLFELDGGSIAIQKSKKIAYMPQELVLNSVRSIFDETLATLPDFFNLLEEVQKLECLFDSGTSDPETITRYAHAQEKLTFFDPEMIKVKAKKILSGLGFSLEQMNQSVATLSGGWKMRVVLAKLLLQEADFYLFDEPTNHLDLVAKEWFLKFLKESRFGFLLICHERYFLDELCDKILELEQGKAIWYQGNYSTYLVQKEHNTALLEAAYIQQQKEITRKQATIERFRASASRSVMAQSMEKALEKIERISLPPAPKQVTFSFPDIPQSGRHVLDVQRVSQTFGAKAVFNNVSLSVERGQKVALVAPNGVGKTTLFNLIAGLLPVQAGTITFGHNVTSAIFSQDQDTVLDARLTIFENIKKLCPTVSDQKIRGFLGAFLFSGDDIQKKVAVLSGGEKNRVGMISVLLQSANLLLLDEPTNHLDIPSKELLLQALQKFTGTVLFVSHDRDFINGLATHIIELTPHGTHTYQGNYDAYVYQKETLNPKQKPEKGAQCKQVPTVSIESSESPTHSLRTLEQEIAKLEKKITALHKSLADFEYGTKEFDRAVSELQKLESALKKAEQEWEEAAANE